MNFVFLIMFIKCCEVLNCGLCLHQSSSVHHYWRNILFVGYTYYRLKFRTSLNCWSTWRIALDNVEKFRSFYGIVNLVKRSMSENQLLKFRYADSVS